MIVKRSIFSKIRAHVAKPEITMIVGARQVGKTTMLKELEKIYKEKGRRVWRLNLDFEEDKEKVKSQSEFWRQTELRLGKEGGLVLIDEVQRREEAGRFLKGLYDKGFPHKLIVTGSGSLDLKSKIRESLVGRKRVFEVKSLSFGEVARWKLVDEYVANWQEIIKGDRRRREELKQMYSLFGGYPRVVLAEELEEKREEMKEIVESYLAKDVGEWLGVRKRNNFRDLVRWLAGRVGRPINLTMASQELGINGVSLREYLEYLEQTFIVERVRSYFANVGKEIRRMPVYYFNDLGLVGYLLDRWEGKVDGFRWQNFVYRWLREKYEEIYYWRTKGGAEVDFVIKEGGELIGVEVKQGWLDKVVKGQGVVSFIKKYHPREVWLVNEGMKVEEEMGGTKIRVIPWWEVVGVG